MAHLSTLLSHALVAFTIELDNEFEQRLGNSGQRARVTSLVMWANFLRFVGDGITVAELPEAAGIPKARTLSTLGGMERWGYVSAGPDSETRRDGFGSARGLGPSGSFARLRPVAQPRRSGVRLPTRSRGAGRTASGPPWSASFDSVSRRSRGRSTSSCRSTCRSSAARTGDSTTPSAAGSTNPRRGSRCPRSSPGCFSPTRSSSSAQSEVALPLSANLLRVVDETGVSVQDVAQRGGISKEAVAMATTFLSKNGYVVVKEKTVHLTAIGSEAQERAERLHGEVEPLADTSRRPVTRRTRRRARSGRRSPSDFDRTRAAGAARGRTWRRPRPGSRIRPERCRTTRWCCTAAAGRTGVSTRPGR